MKEKLNLTIEKDVKERAKRIARIKGVSISEMVQQLLESVAAPQQEWEPREGSVVSKLAGSIPAPGNTDYDQLLAEALMEEQGYEKNID